VLRAAGETKIIEENTEDWLELDGDLGFELLVFIYNFWIQSIQYFFLLFSLALPIILNYLFIFFVFWSFVVIFCISNL
jgi:hypothetical protein